MDHKILGTEVEPRRANTWAEDHLLLHWLSSVTPIVRDAVGLS